VTASDAIAPRRTVELPVGLADATGRRAREAVLRPARVRDEVRALEDFRVWMRPESFPAVLLARVVERIGATAPVDAGLIERLDPRDRAALERAYDEMNDYHGGARSA